MPSVSPRHPERSNAPLTQAEIDRLRWFHSIDFGGGLTSNGAAKIESLRRQADACLNDLAGRTVLDVGCWDGFYSFEARRRGASRVLATDHFAWSNRCWGDRRAIDLACRHIAPHIDVMDIDLAQLSVSSVGRFDVVLFLGVLYHLRHPLAVLEQIAPITTERLVLETHMDAFDCDRPAMVFYPGSELAGDHTNWWGPNRACVEGMLRDVGFTDVAFSVHPCYPERGIFTATR
jgi:tRNA (mo5U34)-methyltransferase